MNKVEFQTKAQDELVDRALTLLSRPTRGSITFKAPTGSGKTVMMANALADLSKKCEGHHNLAILWIAPNKLHEQSHTRLIEVYGQSKALACLTSEELSGSDLPDRSVLFLNWDSIDSEKLVLRRDNETRQNLESYVVQARTAGRKIVLVVDESHLHLNSGEGAQVVVDHIIKPDLIIEVSATPRTQPDVSVTVLREDVIKAGFIRKRVVVNPGEVNEMDGMTMAIYYEGTAESLLDLALAKQAELTRLFQAQRSPVIPLVLVQLPNGNRQTDALARFEEHLYRRHSLSRDEGVAVWLSNDKTPDLADIASNSSSVKVLFFKQAIATGWDCPRAQIIVGLREMKSETFTTQVLGRIIRQPEHRHYADDALNYAYAFTNYEELKLDADTASWVGKALVTAQEEFVLPFENWRERHVDRRGHLNKDVVKCILFHTGRLVGVKYHGPVLGKRLDNEIIEDLDTKGTLTGTTDIPFDLPALQSRLDELKDRLMQDLAAKGDGRKYVEKALRDAVTETTGEEDEKKVLETILHRDNRMAFEKMVEDGISDFLAVQGKAERQKEKQDSWSATKTLFLDLSNPIEGYKKCLYDLVLIGQFKNSDVEKPFSKLLDEHPAVKRWMKNGDHGGEHFAITYEWVDENTKVKETNLFHPDFLVLGEDGRYGLYETKGSGVSELSTGNHGKTKAKAEALHRYLKEQRTAGHVVEGGIVVEKDGKWWIHCGESYPGTKDVSKETGWQPFSFGAEMKQG